MSFRASLPDRAGSNKEHVKDMIHQLFGESATEEDVLRCFSKGIYASGGSTHHIDLELRVVGINDKKKLFVDGSVVDMQGVKTIMTFERAFSKSSGSVTVYHSSLTVTDEYSAKGIGTSFFFATICQRHHCLAGNVQQFPKQSSKCFRSKQSSSRYYQLLLPQANCRCLPSLSWRCSVKFL